jgi:hypothetical protein
MLAMRYHDHPHYGIWRRLRSRWACRRGAYVVPMGRTVRYRDAD